MRESGNDEVYIWIVINNLFFGEVPGQGWPQAGGRLFCAAACGYALPAYGRPLSPAPLP